MKTRTVVMTVAAMMMLGVLNACSMTSLASTDDVKGVIGYVGNTDQEDTGVFAAALEKEAEEKGYECVSMELEESELMTGCIEALTEEVDVLVLAPGESEYAQEMIEAAHVNDVDVVVKNEGRIDVDYDSIIGQSGEEGGALAAHCAIELMTGN